MWVESAERLVSLLIQPDNGGLPTLWSYPVKVVQEIPDLTANTIGGPIFGNLDAGFVYRQARNAAVMRLQERYADFLSVGFIGYSRLDMHSNDMRAVVTVKGVAS